MGRRWRRRGIERNSCMGSLWASIEKSPVDLSPLPFVEDRPGKKFAHDPKVDD